MYVHRNRWLLPWLLAGSLVCATTCAPVIPQRTRPGGAARWAYDLARQTAALWKQDAKLCRIQGIGVGDDGWLPDRGGAWILTFWSASVPDVMEVMISSDARVTTKQLPNSPHRGRSLPKDWADSPRVWAATRSHQRGLTLNTFESEFAVNESGQYAQQAVWRIRFFLKPPGYETHIISAAGKWLSNLPEPVRKR